LLENCPECARLWNAYLEARREHAARWRDLETNPAAPGDESGKAAIQRSQAAFAAREQMRTLLAEHEAAAHKS
jgi:hypothetical protein